MMDKNALLEAGKIVSSKVVNGNAAAGIQPAATSFNMLVSAWSDYKKVQAVEITKRARIQADKEVAIKAIEEQSALLRDYFTQVFAERRGIIEQNFALLEQALAQDNLDMANLAMASINHLVQQSPLAQAKELITSINNPKVEHIEI